MQSEPIKESNPSQKSEKREEVSHGEPREVIVGDNWTDTSKTEAGITVRCLPSQK
ncbi:hypothetical protein ES705_39632 [subsurface metagenome]